MPKKYQGLLVLSAICLAPAYLMAADTGGGTAPPTEAIGPGVFWLGFFFGYFLLYSINTGTQSGDALKSVLGALGIGSGGILAYFSAPASTGAAAGTTAAAATAPAGAASQAATAATAAATSLADVANKAAAASVGALNMGVLEQFTYGALLGFALYFVLALGLAVAFSAAQNWDSNSKRARGVSLFAVTTAKSLLGEQFNAPTTGTTTGTGNAQ